MRVVILDGRQGRRSPPELEGKLLGHLHARLGEYSEEGILAFRREGAVYARIAGCTGEEAARLLSEKQVYALAEGEGLRFVIGAETTFEDLDYVQSAAASLLK